MTIAEANPERGAAPAAIPSSKPGAGPESGEPVIVSEGLTVGYKLHRERKQLTALRDINLTIKKGEFVVLVARRAAARPPSSTRSPVSSIPGRAPSR